jgi:hypothetical protein
LHDALIGRGLFGRSLALALSDGNPGAGNPLVASFALVPVAGHPLSALGRIAPNAADPDKVLAVVVVVPVAGNPLDIGPGRLVVRREFLDRLVMVSIPKIRDFRGLSPRSFDGRGNYTFGVKEQVIFPEIKYDKVEKVRGMDITLVTTAGTDEEGYELLKAMKWPFREK